MKPELSMTNQSFSFLGNSSEFLNLVINNINSCVLLLDKDMRLHAFNDAMKTIFSNRKDEDLQYVRCGEAIGCAHQIEEQANCGETSQCSDCELRVAALNSYLNNEVIFKEHIVKPFFTYENKKVNKHLQFSTRLFHHNKERHIIMIIEDLTKCIERKGAV